MNRLRALRCRDRRCRTGWRRRSARGSEPAQAFLDGLRERGYFDTAADYLDAALDSPLVPGKFKQTALYEKGLILVLGASHERDPAIQETQLDEGQQALQQFVTDQPSHLLATAARSQLGNVLVKRAGIRVERARRWRPAQKQAETKAALAMYDDAAKVFAALVTELAERKKKFSAAIDEKTDPELAAQRDRVRTDYLQAQIFAAATQEEKAMAFDAGSKEQIEALTKASDGYKTVYEEYRTRMAGLYARMYQGRCQHKLGKYKDASSIFTHLLDNPDTPEFRPLRREGDAAGGRGLVRPAAVPGDRQPGRAVHRCRSARARTGPTTRCRCG